MLSRRAIRSSIRGCYWKCVRPRKVDYFFRGFLPGFLRGPYGQGIGFLLSVTIAFLVLCSARVQCEVTAVLDFCRARPSGDIQRSRNGEMDGYMDETRECRRGSRGVTTRIWRRHARLAYGPNRLSGPQPSCHVPLWSASCRRWDGSRHSNHTTSCSLRSQPF